MIVFAPQWCSYLFLVLSFLYLTLAYPHMLLPATPFNAGVSNNSSFSSPSLQTYRRLTIATHPAHPAIFYPGLLCLHCLLSHLNSVRSAIGHQNAPDAPFITAVHFTNTADRIVIAIQRIPPSRDEPNLKPITNGEMVEVLAQLIGMVRQERVHSSELGSMGWTVATLDKKNLARGAFGLRWPNRR